ncbi:peptidoglycan-associated lipoprotein Pal [bacterium]|nr:peptidoglycan-associated lipoprotein Pal [bacterium]
MPTDTDRYEDEIDEATEMTRTDREAMVELEDINFDYDQYALTFEAREVLARNAIFLKRNMSVMIQIEGHCDERGTAEYNLSLGQKRADSTKAYLVSMGIESRRISTISYGEERPLDSGSNEYAWAKNRRAHFLITAR